jgi:DNA-binding transcriptional LysR family regulator
MAENYEHELHHILRKPLPLDLQHLRYVVLAVEYGSFRRAAETLLVRQSTFSRRIRQLEELIGVMIFERSSGGVRVTSAGRDFLHAARSIVEQTDALIAKAISNGRGESGDLTIGFYTSLSAGNMRATLLDYKNRFPKVELGLAENSRTRLITTLHNGSLDVAIVTGEAHFRNGKVLPLWSERILVALPEDHSLCARELIYWTDLRDETVLLSQYDPGRELESLLVSKLACSESRPRIESHAVSRAIITSLVNAGLGISLVTESDVGVSFCGLVYRNLQDGSGPSRVGYSALWREDNDNPALANFLRLLAERYPSMKP